ncbi:MAG: Rrf2 family transcriptional regulator [Acidobacteria bacterium]|nr:Rrf2 family transcriptional regulator [Acidobacteriota bacterium]
MNTRFAVAVHILTLLEANAGKPATSEWIAGSVDTNPALIRRQLVQLAKAGLTRSQMGPGGGALLARPADRITLADVYRAVTAEDDILPIHPSPNPRCPIGRNIQTLLEERIGAAERALEAELGRTTIADLTETISRRAG